MKIVYSTKFAKEYRKLPLKVKLLAEKKEKIFRKNPHHSSLKTHRLTGRLKEYFAFSVNYQYRIIFEFKNKDEVWFHSVGTHSIYSN
ncbi:MAG: type II toxin-antitoxin system YafQ family toxin [Candidatus Levyibacteriota bacterium]